MLSHSLENRNHIQRFRLTVFLLQLAGHDSAAVHKNRRSVQTRHRHQTAGHVFVAAADGNHAVEPLTAGDGFDGVGDDLPRNERVLHAFGAHRNAVGNSRDAEDEAFAACAVHSGGGCPGQLINVHVARRHHVPGGSDADLWLLEILGRKPYRMQHGAAGGAIGAIDNL